MDGERKKKPEKRVGVHLETRDHQKTVNGRGKKSETEIIKIETRTTGTRREREREREGERERQRERLVIETTASDGQGMKVAGEEDQLRSLQAGEMQVIVTIGTAMTGVVREMIAVI